MKSCGAKDKFGFYMYYSHIFMKLYELLNLSHIIMAILIE